MTEVTVPPLPLTVNPKPVVPVITFLKTGSEMRHASHWLPMCVSKEREN